MRIEIPSDSSRSQSARSRSFLRRPAAVAKGEDAATEPAKPAEEPKASTETPVEKEEIVTKLGGDKEESAPKGDESRPRPRATNRAGGASVVKGEKKGDEKTSDEPESNEKSEEWEKPAEDGKKESKGLEMDLSVSA